MEEETPAAEAIDEPIDDIPGEDELDEPEAAPAAEPEAEAAAAEPVAAATDRLEELLTRHNVGRDELADLITRTIDSQAAQQTAAEREAELDKATDPLLAELADRIDRGELTEEEAGRQYREARAIAAERLELQQLRAERAQREIKDAVGRVAAEFPKAPAPVLEQLAGAGVDAKTITALADALHKHTDNAEKNAIAAYVAGRGRKDADANAFAPAGGASPTVQEPGPTYESVRKKSWLDLSAR